MLDDATRNAQPDQPDTPAADPAPGDDRSTFGSLADDVGALIEDGKTYLEAEIAFQKTRAGYAGEKTKQGIVYGLAALAFLHLALIALVVGLVIALAPYLTAIGATAAVTAFLFAGVALFGLLAQRRFRAIGDAFKGDDDEQA